MHKPTAAQKKMALEIFGKKLDQPAEKPRRSMRDALPPQIRFVLHNPSCERRADLSRPAFRVLEGGRA
jgi:hypothetical protein